MIKLTLHFKSGKTIKIKCESYRLDYNKSDLEYSGYSFTGSVPKVSFVPSQLEAYEAIG